MIIEETIEEPIYDIIGHLYLGDLFKTYNKGKIEDDVFMKITHRGDPVHGKVVVCFNLNKKTIKELSLNYPVKKCINVKLKYTVER